MKCASIAYTSAACALDYSSLSYVREERSRQQWETAIDLVLVSSRLTLFAITELMRMHRSRAQTCPFTIIQKYVPVAREDDE